MISVMFEKLLSSAGVVPFGMRVAVRLVFVIVGIQTNKVLFDEDLKLSLVVRNKDPGKANFVGVRPFIGI